MGRALLLARQGAWGELIIECRPELTSLIAQMGVADRLIVPGEAVDVDLHVYVCSLPGLFTRDAASIPTTP